jgi:hypothetical protein
MTSTVGVVPPEPRGGGSESRSERVSQETAPRSGHLRVRRLVSPRIGVGHEEVEGSSPIGWSFLETRRRGGRNDQGLRVAEQRYVDVAVEAIHTLALEMGCQPSERPI